MDFARKLVMSIPNVSKNLSPIMLLSLRAANFALTWYLCMKLVLFVWLVLLYPGCVVEKFYADTGANRSIHPFFLFLHETEQFI